MFRKESPFCLWLLLTCALSGCGSDESNPAASTPAAGAPAAAVATKPSGPAETLNELIAGVQNHRPQVVWENLPASYREDVNSLVRDFAQRMDQEIWQRAFGSIDKLVSLLDDERIRGYVLDNPQFARNPAVSRDDVKANWPHVVGLLRTLRQSDLSDLEKLKAFDGGRFLSATGGALMNQIAEMSKLAPGDPFAAMMRDQLGATRVELVDETGDTARVRLSRPESGEEPQTVEMVRVEGKWIRREMAEGWKSKIAEARADLSQITPESIAAQKLQFLATLDAIDAAIVRLGESKSAEQFNDTAMSYVASVVAMSGGLGQFNPPDGPGNPPAVDSDAAVTIRLAKPADQKQMDDVTDALIDLADDPKRASVLIEESNGQISAKVMPVRDVAAFSKKLGFANVLTSDAEARTITIELKPAAEPKP